MTFHKNLIASLVENNYRFLTCETRWMVVPVTKIENTEFCVGFKKCLPLDCIYVWKYECVYQSHSSNLNMVFKQLRVFSCFINSIYLNVRDRKVKYTVRVSLPDIASIFCA